MGHGSLKQHQRLWLATVLRSHFLVPTGFRLRPAQLSDSNMAQPFRLSEAQRTRLTVSSFELLRRVSLLSSTHPAAHKHWTYICFPPSAHLKSVKLGSSLVSRSFLFSLLSGGVKCLAEGFSPSTSPLLWLLLAAVSSPCYSSSTSLWLLPVF